MSVCVLVQPIDVSGIRRLQQAGLHVRQAPSPDPADLLPLLGDAVAAIVRNHGFPTAAFEGAPRLQVIGVHGTGTDRIDLEAARARAIRVVATPGHNARSVAEHALGLMLAAARFVPASDQAVRAEDFAFRERVRGIELHGRRLGLWGYGRVARLLAGMAAALGMEVVVLSAHAQADELAKAGYKSAETADALLQNCDIVSLHGTAGSHPILGAREIARMRPGAILVNTARGALVDEDALARALTGGHLRAAALDVFTTEPLPSSSPLLGCPNLILSPHVGGSTEEALRRTGLAVAEAVLRELDADR